MKLLIATGTFPPEASGPATYVSGLALALLARGWPVRVVTYSEDRSTSFPYPVTRISRHSPLAIRYWRYLLAVWKHARWADLVYLQGPVSEGLPGALGSRLAGKPYVLKVVGDYAWEQARVQASDTREIDEFQRTPERDGQRVRRWRGIQRWVARHAAIVITPSQYLAGIVTGWGVPAAKIKVIYNAFQPPAVEQQRGTSLREQLQPPGKIILSIGRLVSWKGFAELIAAMPEVSRHLPHVQLFIIGEGPDRPRLERAIQASAVGLSVTLLGQQSTAVTQQYLAAADCLVLNSSYEGLSHVLLEAMAAQVPIVATAVGGNGEVIVNGQNGLLVPVGDRAALVEAVVKILVDGTLVETLKGRYLETLKKFEHQRLVEATMEALSASAKASADASPGSI